MADQNEITCPRCRRAAIVRFYGPCDACRSELVAKMAGTRHHLVSKSYEPKANVVPNFVATKE